MKYLCRLRASLHKLLDLMRPQNDDVLSAVLDV